MSNIPLQLLTEEYQSGSLRALDVGLALKVWFNVETEAEYLALFTSTLHNTVKRAILHVIGETVIDDPIPFLTAGFADSATVVRIAAIFAAVLYADSYPAILAQMWTVYQDPGESDEIRAALRTALEKATGGYVPKWTP